MSRAERIGRQDAAAIMGLPERTVTLLARRKEIPGAAILGRRWTFDEVALRAWIRSKEDEVWQDHGSPRRAATGAARRSGVASRSRASNTDEAYEQMMRSSRPLPRRGTREGHSGAALRRDSTIVERRRCFVGLGDCEPHKGQHLHPVQDQSAADRSLPERPLSRRIDKALVNEIVRRRRMAGVTNATIRRDLTAMSSVLDHAEEEGMSEGNPALARSRRLKERRDPIVLPGTDSINAVLAHAGESFAPVIQAAWLTGCRLEELAGLKWRQVDHKRGQITLAKTKGNRVRVINMRDTRTPFAALPRAATTECDFWHGPDTEAEPASRYASVSTNFRRVVASAQKAARKTAKENKVECTFRPFTFHHLRHRFAVDALRAGMGIYDLQQHLGHSSVQVTEIYLAFITAEEEAAARRGSPQTSAHRPSVQLQYDRQKLSNLNRMDGAG
ncbi:MAG: tyrosine-type recombinase/integrase [Janthinobacterium lividum]